MTQNNRAEVSDAVSVKPLKWVKPHGDATLSRAETIIGYYRVWTHHEAEGKWFWALADAMNPTSGSCDTEQDALAAAEADWQQRIRSALAAAPKPEPASAVTVTDVVEVVRARWQEWNDPTAHRYNRVYATAAKIILQEVEAALSQSQPAPQPDRVKAACEAFFKATREPEASVGGQTPVIANLNLTHVMTAVLNATAPQPDENGFIIGEPVEKFTGEARWEGILLTSYFTTMGKRRYVVEVMPQGFQMIAVPSQLRMIAALGGGQT